MQSSAGRGLRFAVITAILLVCPPLVAEPLHVLLTNDDGFEAPGIVAMHKALLGAGYKVSVAAPREQQSGSSMRVTLGQMTVEKTDENFWADIYSTHSSKMHNGD